MFIVYSVERCACIVFVCFGLITGIGSQASYRNAVLQHGALTKYHNFRKISLCNW